MLPFSLYLSISGIKVLFGRSGTISNRNCVGDCEICGVVRQALYACVPQLTEGEESTVE